MIAATQTARMPMTSRERIARELGLIVLGRAARVISISRNVGDVEVSGVDIEAMAYGP